MSEAIRNLRRWAGDLALGAALTLVLLAAAPCAPLWFALALEDLAHDGALHLLRLPLLALLLVNWTLARGLRRWVASDAGALLLSRTRALLADQNGALIFEFALIFPFIMALVFILFQWSEVLMADGLVNYAAFAAARTAVTYANVAGGDPEQPSGERWKIDQKRLDAMKHAARVALMGAFTIEGGMTHDEVRVSLVDPAQQDVQVQDPAGGRGAYRFVHVKVEWGFIPRWPMSFLFFRPILKDKRILIEGQYAMQVDGYYRSPSVNRASNALADQQDAYANNGSPDDGKTREGQIEKALYDTVLKEAHGASEPVSGTRDQLKAGCQ